MQGAVVANYPWDQTSNPYYDYYNGTSDDATFKFLAGTYAKNNPTMLASKVGGGARLHSQSNFSSSLRGKGKGRAGEGRACTPGSCSGALHLPGVGLAARTAAVRGSRAELSCSAPQADRSAWLVWLCRRFLEASRMGRRGTRLRGGCRYIASLLEQVASLPAAVQPLSDRRNLLARCLLWCA